MEMKAQRLQQAFLPEKLSKATDCGPIHRTTMLSACVWQFQITSLLDSWLQLHNSQKYTKL